MNIILNSKLENLIKQQIISGKYTSIDNVLEEALNLLEKRNQYEQWIEEIGQKIDIAAQQLDRGEGIDGETAINQLRKNLQQNKEG
ncbi:ribbon-helix-helix domain-containing protein [Crocosphaera sp. XPORK-15E]|uniref:ribbon-helix-helix domain-containing protein n=1 Tax=Crocosphaera sp. XPORK-15E TaxID=3110247 RepID=UPI002B1F4A73|nr:type II toxin-antitoxin system ParD family antitoxin [Crocosphaera sp. XPORK-15E]MEA5535455.1 type II toxin-antitoxin system ParD family antitoxin [Crocosphaera sp. XPORK-15E]